MEATAPIFRVNTATLPAADDVHRYTRVFGSFFVEAVNRSNIKQGWTPTSLGRLHFRGSSAEFSTETDGRVWLFDS